MKAGNSGKILKKTLFPLPAFPAFISGKNYLTD